MCSFKIYKWYLEDGDVNMQLFTEVELFMRAGMETRGSLPNRPTGKKHPMPCFDDEANPSRFRQTKRALGKRGGPTLKSGTQRVTRAGKIG